MDIIELYEQYRRHPVVTTDSRNVPPGSLFFALKGANFDGNAYAKAAIEAGAAVAVIDDVCYKEGANYYLVDDVLTCLQQLAHHHRKQFEIPLIAITGSNGKTTTKELISAVLGSHYETHVTPGNFNNHIGLPLTLLAMNKDTEIAVIEMGANHLHEIAALCEIAAPTHGLITNIGKAHLEGFGGIEGVKKGKGELFEWLKKNRGTAFINLDEAYLEAMSEEIGHRVFYQRCDLPDSSRPILETSLVQASPTIIASFRADDGNMKEVDSPLFGHYNFNNIMAAISIGRYFKVPSAKIVTAIESYVPNNNRSQILKRHPNTFVLDAYNANPSSMSNALTHFSQLSGTHKVAILGDMLELGEASLAEHRSMISLAQSLPIDDIFLVGPLFQEAAKGLEQAKTFKDVTTLKEWFDQQKYTDTVFLLKASRGIRLEHLLE